MTLGEFQVFVVEVCQSCAWNHLTEQYLLGRAGLNADEPERDEVVASSSSGRHRETGSSSHRWEGRR
jgi:hypothetical protein